jgi:hypothetical protein
MKQIRIEIEGIPVIVEFSSHSQKRLRERDVTEYEAASLVLKLGERILDMKNGTQFGVIDKEMGVGLVCTLSAIDGDIFIDIVTVLSNHRIYFSKGMKVLDAHKLLEAI